MATTGAPRARFSSGAAGYSLIEMMVAMGMAVIIGAGLYAVMNSQRRSSSSQKVASELQTSCNFALEQIKQDLLLAGYRGDETDDPTHTDATKNFSLATGTELAFEFFDDKAKFNNLSPSDSRFDPSIPYNAQYTEHTSVHYLRDTATNSLLRNVKRWHTATSQYQAETSQPLAAGIKALQFQYFDNNGNSTTTTSDIRNVKILLSCEATNTDPISGRAPQLTLTAAVQPRNIGLKANPKDSTPPGPPQNVRAWNPAVCSAPNLCPDPALGCAKLELRWTANTESDLAGYKILYGFDASGYSNSVQVFRGPKTSGNEYYTLTGLALTNFTAWAGVHSIYKIQVQAFDKNQNYSAFSTPVILGDKVSASSIRLESALGATLTNNDTTVDVDPAAAPATFTAAPPVGWDALPPDATSRAKWNKIVLTWTPSATAGVIGYRIYRGDNAAFVPSDTAGSTFNRIADQTVLDGNAVSFTDTVPSSCTTYHYKIAAINCDPTFPITGTTALLFTATSGQAKDLQEPQSPKIAAASGYRRIILTLTNPVTSGMDAEPDFDHSEIYWNKAPGSFPAFNSGTGLVEPHNLIPKSSPGYPAGTWVGEGTLPTINFNDHSSATATGFNLDPDTTYFFLAVSYDKCGNHSITTSSSVAEGTQCGDCLMPAPAPPDTHDPICWGAPAAMDINNVVIEGCYDYIKLSWDPVDAALIRDFQGYRVYRREGASFFGGNPSTEVLLTGTDASAANYFDDMSSIQNGKTYSYRIMATDCYYEQHHGVTPWPEADNNPDDNYRDKFLSNLSLGGISRNTTREIVSGRLFNPNPSFRHNYVTAWMQNDSTTTLTLQEFTAEWENPAAYITRLIVGPGTSSPAPGPGWNWNQTLPYSTQSGNTVVLSTPAQLLGSDLLVPFTERFATATNADPNMRQDTITLSLKWLNTSTANSVCTVELPPFFVPLGPTVVGVTMSQPAAGTFASAVPGEDGTTPLSSNVVSGGSLVHVFADVFDTSIAQVGIKNVWLFYFATTDLTQMGPTALGTYNPASAGGGFTNYTGIPMTWQGGNTYRSATPIPSSENSNIWFFVLAVDNNDNFDRAPEVSAGTFQYYEQQGNVCNNIPGIPGVVKTETSIPSAKVSLALTKPAKNSDGLSDCTDFRGYRVSRRAGSAGSWVVQSPDPIVPVAADGSYTYNDTSAALTTTDYYYKVTAVDTCSPDARESAESQITVECLGASPCSISLTGAHSPLVSNATTADSFTVNPLTVCTKGSNGTPDELVWVQACTTGKLNPNPIRLKESGDTGTFTIDPGYGGTAVTITKTGTGTGLNLLVNDTDTIAAYAYLDDSAVTPAGGPPTGWETTCGSSAAWKQCTSNSLSVQKDPCIGATAPGQPTLNNPTVGSCPSSRDATLTWSLPAGTVSYYTIQYNKGTTAAPGATWTTVRNTTAAETASRSALVNPDGGKMNAAFYWFRVIAVYAPTCTPAVTPLQGTPAAAKKDPC